MPPADVEALASELAGGVVEPAEEQRCAGQVAERLDAAVEVGFEVLLGDWVSAQRPQREHVFAHQPEVFAGLAEVGLLSGEHRIVSGGGFGGWGLVGGCGRFSAGAMGPAGRRHGSSPRWRGEAQETGA
jgi:hypothetical protein